MASGSLSPTEMLAEMVEEEKRLVVELRGFGKRVLRGENESLEEREIGESTDFVVVVEIGEGVERRSLEMDREVAIVDGYLVGSSSSLCIFRGMLESSLSFICSFGPSIQTKTKLAT